MTFVRPEPSRRPGRQSTRRRHPRAFTLAVLAMLIVSASLLTIALVQRDSATRERVGTFNGDVLATIAVLDVGQALSVAIVTDDGASLLYDFGLSRADAEEVIIPFFEERDVERIDYAVLSHPHQDHVGGLPTILEEMPIGLFVDPVLETTNQTYFRSLEMVEELEIDVAMARRGDQYELGRHVQWEVLWPTDDLLLDSDGIHLLNDNSAVVLVRVGETSLLLTGDIEGDAEARLVDDYGDELAIDILQIAHHGSNTSTQDRFLEMTAPDIGIIPVGRDNQYGHPHAEVVQRLRRHEVHIYRTDVDGTVIIETDGQSFEVTTTRTDQSWVNPAYLPRWIASNPMPMDGVWRYSYSMTSSN